MVHATDGGSPVQDDRQVARSLRVLVTEIGNFASGDEALYLAAARRILGFGHEVSFLYRVDQSRGLAAAGLPVRQIPFDLRYQGRQPRSLDELLDGFQHDEPRRYRELAGVVRAHDVVAVAPGGRFVEGYKNFRAMLTAALAHRLGRPVIQLHQSFGPLSDECERACLRDLLALSRLVLVRDDRSLAFVRSLGVEGDTVHEVRDAVFAEPYPVNRQARYRVGLNIRTGFNGHVTKAGIEACLRELIHEIPPNEILVYSTTFPMDPDIAVVAASLGCIVETSLVTYPRYLDLPAACAVIAADSFHGFIFSVLAGTPAVACQPDFRSWKLQGTTCPGHPGESVHPGARTAEDGRTLARAVLDMARDPAAARARQSALHDHARRGAEHGWTQVGRVLADMPRRSPSRWASAVSGRSMGRRAIAPPKVVFLAGRDPTEEIGGGHSSYVRAVARAATALGCDVDVYCVSGRSGNELLDYGLVRRVAHRGRPCRQTQVAFHAPALIAAATNDLDSAGPPALIHSFGVWGHVGHGLQARWRAAGHVVPHLMSMYTVYEEESLALLRASAAYGRLQRLWQWLEWRWIRSRITPLEREALFGADAVAVNYESVRALLVGHHGIGDTIERIGYSPESAFLSDSEIGVPNGPPVLGLDDGRPLIVTITLQRPKKGVDKFLQALALLRQRGLGFRACVVGGGPLLAAHRALARDLKLDDQVVFAGLVPDVQPYLRAAEIFVLPSLREESGSLALLEAMQAGCAIVASGIDGILEDIRHGEDGLLVESGDSEGLAAAIESLLNDPARRSRLAAAASNTFEQRFSADAHVRELGGIYHRLGVPVGGSIVPVAIPAVRP